MKSLANGERIGDWIVESRLGEGAMATVYRCRHALSGRLTAAVKLLRPEVPGDNADKWFLREIETLASLTHPGIVRILHPGHDKERGAYFLAMELIAGRTLRQRLHTGPLTSGEARDLFASLAEALSVAHAAHIFHRDIKPSNIMIRPDGTPVLLDFGIATASDPADQTTTAVGTPTYMAPELFDAGPIDPAKADLYSMGVVLYECLTGSRPFAEGDSKRHSSERVATTVAAKLRTEQLDPGEGVEAGLREIVRRLSRRDPAQRIASMEEAARLLRDEPRLPSIGSMGPDAIARALPPKAPAAAAPSAAPAEDGAVLRRWIVGGVLVALGLSILLGGAAWLWVMSL
jgi:serine/threonine-protein kinase